MLGNNRGKGPGMKYRVLIEQDEDSVYVAEAPTLPGCTSQGETREAAVENIKETTTVYLKSLEAHDAPVPPPNSAGTSRLPSLALRLRSG